MEQMKKKLEGKIVRRHLAWVAIAVADADTLSPRLTTLDVTLSRTSEVNV